MTLSVLIQSAAKISYSLFVKYKIDHCHIVPIYYKYKSVYLNTKYIYIYIYKTRLFIESNLNLHSIPFYIIDVQIPMSFRI